MDHETKDTYMVTLMAEDSFGASDTIMVTIMVTDMDEAPDVTGEVSIEYAENGTRSVASYTAVDPDMTAIASWSLDGDDAGEFTIEGGVLTFKKSPDFEMPGDEGTDRIYSVTVQATDETNKVGTKAVMVEVTNVEEPGMVRLSALQPQSTVESTATHTDPDGTISDLKWQWAKSRSKNGSYPDIDDAILSTYTPDDDDVGYYLRATASYTDAEGSGKSAMVKSDNSVQRVPGSNEAPTFKDSDDVEIDVDTREVAENTAAGQAIGDPVVAEDPDGDILTYTLPGDAAESFDIDRATGQIMTKAALDVEMDATYMVVVRATDPSGLPLALESDLDAGNSDTITVTITVTGVNEPPAVTGDAAVPFQENGTIDTPLHTYMEDDPETDDDSTWSLSGTDSGKFELAANGDLTFEAQPDFEVPGDTNGDNVYEVTVVAADSDGNRGDLDVKITVTNAEEDGTVTLSRNQPRVGVSVRATLTDPDGSISGLTWQWYRSGGLDNANLVIPTTACAEDDSNDCAIKGATSDSHTPTEGDVGETLTAVAMYNDGEASGKTAVGEAANVVARDTRNKPPAFVDQDVETDGDQSESTERMVEENTKALAGSVDNDDAMDDNLADNVGSPVMAEDPDPNLEPLIYTLSGADSGPFRVRGNGQIEVAAGTELDHETKDTYMVTLMAEDSFGASDTIMVTIMVTDMDEAPEIMRTPEANVAPEFASATTSRTVAENTAAGEDIGNPVAANDANGDTLSYTLGGADAASFNIDPDTGQLMTLAALDYETKTTYSVTVTARPTQTAVSVTPSTSPSPSPNVDDGIEVSGPAAVDWMPSRTATKVVATLHGGWPRRRTALALDWRRPKASSRSAPVACSPSGARPTTRTAADGDGQATTSTW